MDHKESLQTKEPAATWLVTLKDPQSGEPICSGRVEADSTYWAKKAYFHSLYQTNPDLPKTPSSIILSHMSAKRLEAVNLRTSEFPPENFFEQIKANYKELTLEEQLVTSGHLSSLIAFVTEESLKSGKIPKECPICRSSSETLTVRYWNPREGNPTLLDEKTKGKAALEGCYRRMCASCNSLLDTIFKNNHPTSWELQHKTLLQYLKPRTEAKSQKQEERWSLLSKGEWNRIKYLWTTIPETILTHYLNSQLKKDHGSATKKHDAEVPS